VTVPENPPDPLQPQASATPATAPPEPPTKFEIGEEFGTAKKNLPPVKILLIGAALIVVVAGIVQFAQRPSSAATGSLSDIVSVEVPDQNFVMVAINVTVENRGDKPYWIHTLKADLETAGGHFSDQAASAVDFDRYFQAFPVLKENALPALQPEARIPAGGRLAGTMIVSFPVTADAFAQRKSLKVSIQPYDQPVPLVLSK